MHGDGQGDLRAREREDYWAMETKTGWVKGWTGVDEGNGAESRLRWDKQLGLEICAGRGERG